MRIFKWIAGFLSLGFIVLTFHNSRAQNPLENRYVRLHVVANSDSKEDQDLKLKVRDRILCEFIEEFEDVNTAEEARIRIDGDLDRFKEVAKDEIKRYGKDYDIRANLGRFEFPIRTYKDLVLPAGVYNALKIEIGEAKGANWWCVMFPPLCFVDASHKDVDYEENDDTKEHTIEFRFKSKEWLENSLPKVKKILSSIPILQNR
ncbi:MAG: stage II sporulation protein R [Clostridiales bacterium]|nr:stage II sporulation protein R [Clostridiales bacterium]